MSKRTEILRSKIRTRAEFRLWSQACRLHLYYKKDDADPVLYHGDICFITATREFKRTI